jgi:hypothetical protein
MLIIVGKMTFRQNIITGKNRLLLETGAVGFLLSIFVFCWYFFFNRYSVLVQEQMQMFLFTRSYLLQYLHQPGGLTLWAGTFLTQFFLYPLAGACIYSFVFLAFYSECRKMLIRFSVFGKSLSVAYIPALLLLPAIADIQFDIGVELNVVIALVFFRLLTLVTKHRYAPAMIFGIVILCYYVIAGNAILTVFLFLIFCLYSRQRNCLLQMATAVVAWSLAPLAFSYMIYPVSVDEAYRLYTPLDKVHTITSTFRNISWLSVVILPLAGLTVRKINVGRKTVRIADITVIAAILLSIIITRRVNVERIMKTMYESGKGNWAEALSTAKKTATGPLQCFYLNLALQQTGSLPDSMFHYRQIGVSGLIPDLTNYIHCYVAGDLFYRLGLLNKIRQCSYESIVGRNYYKEYDIRNMKRLFECAEAANDSALAEKYRYRLNKTLFYKTKSSPDNMKHNIAVTPADDALFEGKASALEAILRANPFHRPAFEYLMAYYMLEKNYDKAKECFDACYAGLEYPSLPVHYAELLTLYKYINNLDDSFYQTYPVPNSVRERFDMIEVLLPHVLTDEKVRQATEKQFGDTYWFYIAFPLVDISHTNENERKTLY